MSDETTPLIRYMKALGDVLFCTVPTEEQLRELEDARRQWLCKRRLLVDKGAA